MTTPAKTPKTIIKRSSSGDLCLLLPDNSGHYHELVLQAGKVEQILHLLLSKQESGASRVGKAVGPSWKFLLESGLLATQKAKVIPQGVSGLGPKLETKRKAEDLGL